MTVGAQRALRADRQRRRRPRARASDESGARLAERLTELGFEVERGAVPDDAAAIASGGPRRPPATHRLVVTHRRHRPRPRDVTPQALAPLLDYVMPGLAS